MLKYEAAPGHIVNIVTDEELATIMELSAEKAIARFHEQEHVKLNELKEIGPEEALSLLGGVSESSLKRYRAAGLPYIKGRPCRYRYGDVIQFRDQLRILNRQRTPHPAPTRSFLSSGTQS